MRAAGEGVGTRPAGRETVNRWSLPAPLSQTGRQEADDRSSLSSLTFQRSFESIKAA